MKRAGIVCEFNPLHNGHLRLMQEVRRAGAAETVCVLASDFVQRCEPAFIPQYKRAEAAVRCGADMVVSLPFPYSCASAEFYAGAAVYLLKNLGCDTIAFGSESGDLDFLLAEASKPRLKAADCEGSASALDRLSPNDILGVEYIRAAKRCGYSGSFFTVRRNGDGHGTDSGCSDIPSATALRSALRRGDEVCGVPAESLDVIKSCIKNGEAVYSCTSFEDALLGFWRVCRPADLSGFAECGGGVCELLHKAALKAVTYEGMMAAAATKKYTNARLRRAALYGFIEVETADLKEPPAYARVLALGPGGCKICRDVSDIPLVTKVRDFPAAGMHQCMLQERAESMYTLCLKKPVMAGGIFSKSCFVIGK